MSSQPSFRVSRTFFLLPLLVIGFLLSSQSAHAAVLNSYNFNTTGDLTTYFNSDVGEAYTESASAGLGGTRAVNVDTVEGLYAAKTGYAALDTGETLTISAYFYNDGGNGYGTIGFVDASPSNQSNALPDGAHGMSVRFHGGGGSYYRNTTEAASMIWSGGDLADATWYRVVFSLTKEVTADSYAADFQLWEANSDGEILVQKIAAPVDGFVNADLAGQTLYPFFATALTNRFVTVDNIEITDELFVGTPYVPTFSGTGTGTEIDPYIITTCEQLQEMNNFLDADFVLGNNIDCTGTATWNGNTNEWESGTIGGTLIDDPYTGVINNGYFGFEPIGQDDVVNNAGSGFTGTLDGQGYTISDVWIFRKETDYNGVIGYATNATIKNITLDNPHIVGRSHTGGFLGYGSGVTLENLTNTSGMVRAYLAYYGGGIAGYLIDTSTATALTVTDGTVHGSGNVIGGLVGYLHTSSVTNSTTGANVDGGEYIGGAFGEVYDAQIDNVDATGSVDSNDADDAYIAFFSKESRYAGGFAGSITGSTVENSTASGLITSEGDYTGGFAGRIHTSDIFDSSATGTVSGNESVGGFGGTVWDSEITDSFATGNVQSVGGNVGGFAGQTYCENIFLRVSASGNVTAGNGNAGGFTGFDGCEGPGSTFNQVSAHGNVTGNNVIGGFVGESYSSTFINAYSSGSVTGNDQVGSFAATLVSGDVTNVYARGLVTLTAPGTLVGGFANDASNTDFTNSFWDGEAIDREDACNTGACSGLTELTTAQAKTQSTYTDAVWDFDGIWDITSENAGYPHFFWETNLEQSDDTTDPVLTIIQAIPDRVTLKDAEIRFTTSESCTILAEQPLSSLGDVELTFTESSVGMTIIGRLNGMQVGGTYSYAFICRDEANNASNLVEVGPFTVIAASSTGGFASPAYLASQGIKLDPTNSSNQSSSLGQPGLCSTEQLITQNLRAPSRNGVFNSYTKGIVTEAKILQTHLNRLGFNSGPEDGILGPISTGAIKRMQTFLKTTPDGFVGPITRGLLNNSCGTKTL